MEKCLIVGVLLIGALGRVSSLRCYECTNCLASELKDEQLVTCGDTMTTTTVVTATDTTTATSGNPTTITPSIVGPGTTASTSTILDPGTAASTSTTLDPGTTASTSATANPGTTTSTNAPVNPGTTTPSASVDNGTTNSTNTITVDNKITTNSPQALRVKRDVPVIVDLNSECTCFRGKCTCEEEAEFPRIFPYADATNITTYVCAKGTVKVNGTDVITRGCVKPKVNEQEICGYLVENLNVTACNTCTTDKCNSGFVMQHSIGIILVLTLVVFIK